MTIEFNNTYCSRRKKPEFFTTPDTENDLTDQSQLANASIKEMAKKFGIEALENLARKQYLEEGSKLKDTLYGNDFTKLHTSKEELLNTKKKVAKLFEQVPAILRKELFHDNPIEFVNAYVSNDENKLSGLHKAGIISDTQINIVKEYNRNLRLQKEENIKKQEFITKLENQHGALYEQFKKTGDIIIPNPKDTSTNNDLL